MRNFFLTQITLPLTLSLAAFVPCGHSSPVLVIDEGVDLSHPLLAPKALVNAIEANGQAGVDDDNNGFVDDIAGWNAVSDDGEYFPTRIRNVFEKNREKVKQLLDLYSQVELGDMNALRAIQANPYAARAIQSLMSVSHGTHVAGIVAGQFQKNTPFLQSYNVFTSSKEPQEDNDETTSSLQRPSAHSPLAEQSYSTAFMKNFATILAQDTGPMAGPLVVAPPSAFDDISNFSTILQSSLASSNARASRLKSYLRTHPQSAVNLSLGFSKALYVKNLNQLWVAELEKRGLDSETLRTPAQEQVLQALADQVVEINKSFYQQVFSEFSNTLFVVAAGNDGDATDPNAGNNDGTPVWPANFSNLLPNVITIAAVDARGTITDFSNFGATTVNVAAPGKAIRSTAPGGLDVVMSGTSMAAPYVTGLAARLRTLNPRLSAVQTRKILERTGRKTASLDGKCTTASVVDPDAAAQAAISSIDLEFDKAIESAVRARDVFSGKTFIMSSFKSILSPFTGEKSKTPKMVRDMMRGVFYK